MSRRSTTVAAVAVSAALLSACGTGLEAQTYKEVGRQDGGSATSQDVAVRNLYANPPLTGSTIPTDQPAVLTGFLVNTGDTADSLVSASSDVAATTALQEEGKPTPSVAIPARGHSTTTWSIVLTGLTKELHAGEYVSVTLTFARAGRTTVQAPIRAGDNGLLDRKPAQDPYRE